MLSSSYMLKSMKAKHIDLRIKFVRNYARCDIVAAQYLRFNSQLVDLMVKAMDAVKLAPLRVLVGLGKMQYSGRNEKYT